MSELDLTDFEQFIFNEARCIDERRWDDWLALFADDGDYWIPLCLEDEEPGTKLSIVHEDRAKLEFRCRRYSHPAIHAQIPPSQTCHLISNIMLDSIDEDTGACELHAQFSVREYRLNKMVDWAGALQYRLNKDKNIYKIKRKKVLLLDVDSEMEVIQVPL